MKVYRTSEYDVPVIKLGVENLGGKHFEQIPTKEELPDLFKGKDLPYQGIVRLMKEEGCSRPPKVGEKLMVIADGNRCCDLGKITEIFDLMV
jgi:hypothetical protein